MRSLLTMQLGFCLGNRVFEGKKPGHEGRNRVGGFVLLFVLLMGSGCHSLRLAPPVPEKLPPTEKQTALTAPGTRSFRLSQYVFFSDFEVKQDQPLFRELADLRDQVYKELHLSNTNSLIQVYIFEDRDHYERFMGSRYPDLPKRRAFFVAQPHSVGGAEDLLVYTFWGDRIREDLRHELTHALLHSVLKDVPLWLDEGLAEYYEVPPENHGINYRHLEQITAGMTTKSFKPDLNHLEQLTQVQQMTPTEYREAWAWVHLMLQDRAEGKVVLTDYLQQLRFNPAPGTLQEKLAAVFPDLDEAFIHHVRHLPEQRTITHTAQRTP
jgi:hypothetical protein